MNEKMKMNEKWKWVRNENEWKRKWTKKKTNGKENGWKKWIKIRECNKEEKWIN